MLTELERHVSADGLLSLVALVDESGDIACGFEDTQWHTHGDLLDVYGVNKGDLSAFLASIVSGQQVIGILRKNNLITDAWVVSIYDQVEDDKHRQEDEALQFRLWDGTVLAEFPS